MKNVQPPPEVGFLTSLQVLRTRVVEGRLDQIGRFYDKYHEIDKSKIHEMLIKHMIKFKKIILELKTAIPDKVWEIIDTLKRKATKEDFKIREKTLDFNLPVCSIEEKTLILNLLKPHLRKKMRTLHIMNKDYELITKETKKAFEKLFLE